MARPVKEGLDYFTHDTDAVSDEKIEALRVLYGNDGYAFYFIMLERIYRTNNFEIDISDAETREETFQILARKVAVTREVFEKILKTALKWGCFNKEAYEQRGVITSNGVKKRANVVVKKREEMRDRYQKTKVISAAETTQETQPETPQSKEKKSIVKESIGEQRERESEGKPNSPDDNYFRQLIYDTYGDGMSEDVIVAQISLMRRRYEESENMNKQELVQ